jgi:hypothetical protein
VDKKERFYHLLLKRFKEFFCKKDIMKLEF